MAREAASEKGVRYMNNIHSTSLYWLLLAAIGTPLSACQGEDQTNCTKGTKCGAGGSETGGSGGSTGGSAGETSVGGSLGGGSADELCKNPKPVVAGHDTGIFACDGGFYHRAQAKECPSELPRSGTVEWPDGGDAGAPGYRIVGDECEQDADCETGHACTLVLTNPSLCPEASAIVHEYARVCVPGCRTDADCGPQELCVCGPVIGECRQIAEEDGCREDADCGPDSMCLDNGRASDGNFGKALFSCSRPEDECQECTIGKHCAFGPDGKFCEPELVCGRPFLVEEVERCASVELRDGWGTMGEGWPGLSGNLREKLLEHWTRIGLMEHASIAAFARFTLELLALGAPASLIEASNQALVDETRHAQIAFGIASSLAGRAIGPGPLSLEGALAQAGRAEELLRTTFREGCVGETRAALEVARSAVLCEDLELRRVLEGIAEDESRHAELAFRVVRYLVESRPALRSVLALEIERARERAESRSGDDFSGPAAEAEREAERFGLLGARELERVHREAFVQVILPCAEALLTSVGGEDSTEARVSLAV